ncbi:RNA polymerase II transcription factor B subunit 2 isoform X2 [Amborella trichopoda]|uniref:RNA polymerase II transcription factor B subunit 2 isoform X2 n=1 Tax=Amborella trichopoda TaxID=13333 RepID=UPI0009BF3E69|nr:RNA polymerase II transcription factor B subunit 2 isoform X2 [Amborella trichopoda]|eukprot:XP_020525409.1 RNA polymerase II transcription factor B subunit 2 isoform X2 [Amborella trichopoda]
MPQVKIVPKNFMDMVAALPASKLDSLYTNTFFCEAVLRSLPPVSKMYVLRMLYIDAAVSAKLMQEWVLPDSFSKHKAAIDRLLQLRVFTESIDSGTLSREPMPSSVTVRLPTLEELDAYALQQWECFLLQLINSSLVERPTNFSPSMMKVFQRGLITTRDNEAPKLTENGFRFLLMETHTQLWYIMREYISTSEGRGMDTAELISFLLELSFHVTGEAYNMNTLTEVQQIAIKDLATLGLVKLQQGRKESWFIPTKLATNLSVSLSDSSSRKEGFVVVETNFRLYAYSTSKLHCEILRLFCRIEYQLPNLIVGAITKESLYTAFDNGITSEQIILFLQQHAHPRVAQKAPAVPENVTDQIRLWETDLNRVEMNLAHFYEDFPSMDIYEAACDYARELGGFLWEDSKKMRLIVRGEMHEEMKDFLRRQK